MGIIDRITSKTDLKLAQIERELGFGNGTMRKWDTSLPSFDKVVAVANLIDISVDYLAGKEDKSEEKVLTYGNSKKDELKRKIDSVDLPSEKIDLLLSMIDSWK